MRDSTLHIRTTMADRTLIERAAEASGRNRTEFLLQAAREKAIQVLLDQTLFVLAKDRFESFQELIEKPIPADSMQALKAFRRRAAPWDQNLVPARRTAAR